MGKRFRSLYWLTMRIGGATGINYVIGLIRTKAVAVLLGPSGVGLVGLYVSITGLVFCRCNNYTQN